MTTTFLQSPVPRHMSYSQMTSLSDCPLRYYLERVRRVPAPPNMAAVGGKAMHVGIEWLDLWDESESLVARYLTLHYDRVLRSVQRGTEPASHDDDQVVRAAQVAKLVERTAAATEAAYRDGVDAVEAVGLPGPDWENEHVPQTVKDLWDLAFAEEIENEVRNAHDDYKDPATWKCFGRATKAWPEKENRDWWNHHGPIFLMRWIVWRATSGYQLIHIDGDPDQPAIEMDASASLGDIEIKAYIDRLFLDEHNQPTVVDAKSNSRCPTDGKQLGVYAILLGRLGFPRPAKGAYWWARDGLLHETIDLTDYDQQYLEWEFHGLREMRNAGFYPANTKSTTCSYCPVRPYCHANGGELAHLVPPPWFREDQFGES